MFRTALLTAVGARTDLEVVAADISKGLPLR